MRKLSSQDAAFIYAETPSWHMHVAALGIINPHAAPTPIEGDIISRIRELTLARLPELPQFRWKLVETPLGVDRPYWVEAEHLDPDEHIFHVTVPAPGTEAELDTVVDALLSTQLRRDRPMWELYLIDGLADGRIGMLTKVHHALIDGISGAGLMEILMDITPEPRPPSDVVHEQLGSTAPSPLVRFVQGMASSTVDRPRRIAAFTAQTTRQGFEAAGRLMTGERNRPMPALPFQAPRTILNGEFTPRRQLSRAHVDLDRVLELKGDLGVKVNDVVLAMVSGALRAYLLEHDALPQQPLIVQCPVSLRTVNSRAEVGSQVGSIFVNLATHLSDPLERVRQIAESTGAGKQMRQHMARHQRVGVTEVFAPAWIGLAARLYTTMHLGRTPPPVNLVVSNVPGPPIPIYVGGAPLEAIYPMGPLLLGMGLNVTALSHDGRIDMGVFTCPDLVDDPKLIAAGLAGSLDELDHALRR